MARLPSIGGDDWNWGTVLNDFLSQAHNSDGSLKTVAIVANVKDYGAKGDNSTNDTSTIQSAINAGVAAGIPVYFPPGVYRTTSLNIPAGTVLPRCKFGRTWDCP